MPRKFVVLPALCLAMLLQVPSALAAARNPDSAPEQSRGVTLRVGAGCAFATIQAAIDSVAEDSSAIIRIRDAFFEENLIITNRNIELIGGHDSCSDNNPDGVTAISGTSSFSPTLFVRNDRASGDPDSVIDVFLINLDLQNGSAGSLQIGGGLRIISDHVSGSSAQTNVTLENTWVHNNQAGSGGGIGLRNTGAGGNGGQFTMSRNSRIISNQAIDESGRGGGLLCEGNFQLLLLGGDISNNTAGVDGKVSARGGGMYLNGCDLDWFAHDAASGSGSLNNNTVHGSGGGLYVTAMSTVDLIGAHFAIFTPASTRPFRVYGNRAFRADGGGIYASMAGTRVTVDRGWVYNNTATAQGGGLFTASGAVINVTRSQQLCHDNRRCSQIYGNRTEAAGGAAGFAVNTGSQINLSRTVIHDNISGTASAQAALVAAVGGRIRLEDSLLYGPAGLRYALYTNDGQLQILRSTIADTGASSAVFFLQGDGAMLAMFDSIVHETSLLAMVATGTGSPGASSDCNIWHDDGLGALGTANRNLIADPRFVDRAAGRYYLAGDSPGINYCDVAPPSPGVDLEWRPRGIVQPDQPERYGPYDLGAFEILNGIFSDRFEAP